MSDDFEFVSAKDFAGGLRNKSTRAESVVWEKLRASRTGYKFSRQIRVGDRIVDFCNRQHRLVIEVDGTSHDGKEERDQMRDEALRREGYEVLRFRNEEVFDELERVVREIVAAVEKRPRWRY